MFLNSSVALKDELLFDRSAEWYIEESIAMNMADLFVFKIKLGASEFMNM